ncbi:MAG: glycosyltransferase [Pyrinomonadaceae bacterium]|nr:glycosyltransferase [Pyrinomonadaceae bacterium]
MNKRDRRVMLVGQFGPGALECSYRTAFESLGWEVMGFDIGHAIEHYCRVGRLGQAFNAFVPVAPWIRKANRDLVIQVVESQPDYLCTFGHYPIQAGALAQIRSASSAALVHIWPDTLANLVDSLIVCLPLFDLVASYSQSSLEHLQKLGARRVAWIPLAGDPSMHAAVACSESEKALYSADVTFIGGWRPEREKILSTLASFDLKIWGPDWGRRCRTNAALLKKWQGRALYEADFAKAVSSSGINLNIIDPLNFPAANMRFFEVAVAGGLQVCGLCPEMERDFVHGEHLFYYRDANELSDLIVTLVEDAPLRARVARSGQAKVLAAHTYTDRVRTLLQQFENGIN